MKLSILCFLLLSTSVFAETCSPANAMDAAKLIIDSEMIRLHGYEIVQNKQNKIYMSYPGTVTELEAAALEMNAKDYRATFVYLLSDDSASNSATNKVTTGYVVVDSSTCVPLAVMRDPQVYKYPVF